MLLAIADLPKSTYYYQLKNFNHKEKKDEETLELIQEIFEENLKKYGSPRITLELQKRGYNINEKRVARIMKDNGISAAPRKRHYRQYISVF